MRDFWLQHIEIRIAAVSLLAAFLWFLLLRGCA